MDIITTNGNDPKLNYKLIKDAYLGFKYFNKLKEILPTFGYTYCYMKCTKIEDDYNYFNKNRCNKTEYKNYLVPYVITDNYINNNIDIIDIIDNDWNINDRDIYIYILLQLFNTMVGLY